MTVTHPNRNPNSAAASPSPTEVHQARLRLNLTCEAAGAIVYERGTRWARFEAGTARMHPAAWELWQLKTEPGA